ncbi:MAG: hypothetical protein M3552_17110 [Planctomycetota bacterium]|nr:hypothetical protein [Planctomycetota bacterium]
MSSDLAPGEAVVVAATFAVIAAAALKSLRSEIKSSSRSALRIATLLLSLVFVAGLSENPLTIIACLGSVAAVIGFSVAGTSQVSSSSNELSTPAHPTADLDTLSFNGDAAARVSAVAEPQEYGIRFNRSARGGTERVEGSMSLEFAANEAVKTLHVPLWPPLDGDPAVECKLDGLDGRVRVPLAKRHGLRIEVRLPDAVDEPLAGTLRFVATAIRSTSAAA